MRKIYSIIFALMTALAAPAIQAYASTPAEEAVSPVVKAPVMRVTSTGIVLTASDDSGHQFYIYSITGQMIKTVTVYSSPLTVELYPGCYIVKCSDWAKQIVVR
ncbi:MAG: hypothetical protein NC117_02290 [Pseudoflavonifractor sp.]|nr:hypothetical protein [Pseudoflavonifractor sp.]